MLHLGCEIEFMRDSEPSLPWRVHREYYTDMWEVNSFLATGETVGELITQLHEYAQNVVRTLGEGDERVAFEHAIGITGGWAFCGVHLHIMDDDNLPPNIIQDGIGISIVDRHKAQEVATTIGKAVMTTIARKRGLSFRQIMSHHIWGKHRLTENSWKENNRYTPVLYNRRHNTYELRCIDFDMLLPENIHHLRPTLKTAFDVLKGVNRAEAKWLWPALTRGIPMDSTHADFMGGLASFMVKCSAYGVELLFELDIRVTPLTLSCAFDFPTLELQGEGADLCEERQELVFRAHSHARWDIHPLNGFREVDGEEQAALPSLPTLTWGQ